MDEGQLVKGLVAYLYGRRAAEALEGRRIEVRRNSAGRPRWIYVDGELAFVYRNNDGYLLPTLAGARYVGAHVSVTREAAAFVARGRNVPARHVAYVDPRVGPNCEVAVAGPDGHLLAVGRLVYSRRELTLGRGYAVRTRQGVQED